MDITPDPVRAALIGAFLDHVRAVEGLAAETLRHRDLHRDRLDLAAGQAHVIGKGARPRLVVVPDPLRPILAEFLDEVRPRLPDSPLLLSNPSYRVTTPLTGFSHEALYRDVELAGEDAGVPGRHFPHRWRHTFATELVRAGIDIHVVQRLLGHRSVISTVGYTHLAIDDLQQAVSEVCPDRGGRRGAARRRSEWCVDTAGVRSFAALRDAHRYRGTPR